MKYVFDTNIFIDAYKSFYAMDIVPLYWKLLGKFVENNEFYLIDKVYNEILKGKMGYMIGLLIRVILKYIRPIITKIC